MILQFYYNTPQTHDILLLKYSILLQFVTQLLFLIKNYHYFCTTIKHNSIYALQ